MLLVKTGSKIGPGRKGSIAFSSVPRRLIDIKKISTRKFPAYGDDPMSPKVVNICCDDQSSEKGSSFSDRDQMTFDSALAERKRSPLPTLEECSFIACNHTRARKIRAVKRHNLNMSGWTQTNSSLSRTRNVNGTSKH